MRKIVVAIVVATIATIAFGVVRDDNGTVQAQTPEVFSDIVNFVLEDLTIPEGTTVTWTNLDSAPHTSTSGLSPIADEIWDTGFLFQNDTADPILFDQVGVFDYFCAVHPEMQATVTVEPATDPIPSLSTWGLISLATLLAGLTLWKIVRKNSERLSDSHIVGGA